MFRQSLRSFQRLTRTIPSSKARNIELIRKATKDVESATNELRWLAQHVRQQYPNYTPEQKDIELTRLCKERSQHVPLQYIIGSQPFGSLEIKCTPGVLIPRPETEAYTMHLSKFLRLAAANIQAKHSKREDLTLKVNILDLCSGSGCISLLLYETLRKHYRKIQINGWDISNEAIKNAEYNIYHNVGRCTLSSDVNNHVKFHQGDIFKPLESGLSEHIEQADIIIANPPYISEQQFVSETEESVRRYEPKLALVPDVDMAETWLKESKELSPSTKFEDVFYHRMIPYWADNAKCKLMVMEVGDDEQAIRVVTALLSKYSSSLTFPFGVQIWRDWPDHQDPDNDEKSVVVEGLKVNVIGAGKMRAVVFVAGDTTAMKESAMDTVMVGNLADMGQVLDRTTPLPTGGGGLLDLLFGFH